MDRWNRLQSMTLRMRSLGGLVPVAKGLDRTFPLFSVVTATPKERRVVFHDYPRAGVHGVFHNGAVASVDDPRASIAPINHRLTFAGSGKLRRWQPLDAVYFFGY